MKNCIVIIVRCSIKIIYQNYTSKFMHKISRVLCNVKKKYLIKINTHINSFLILELIMRKLNSYYITIIYENFIECIVYNLRYNRCASFIVSFSTKFLFRTRLCLYFNI